MLRFVRTCMHVAVLAMALMAIACGGGSSSPSAPTNQDPTPVTPTVAITGGASTMRAGEETTFTAIANGQPVAASWSANPGSAQLVPTVGSPTTKFSPTAEGKYSLTATAPGANPGTTTVTVTAPLPIPPYGELGMALAYNGGTTLRAPIAGSLTIVVPPEAGSYKIPEIALQDLREALGVPVSVSATASGSGENIFASVPVNLAQVCGDGGICLSGSQLYLARWGNLENPAGMEHEVLHRLLPGHCTKEQEGCSVMGSGWMAGLASPKEKGTARWVQNGGK